MEPTSGVKRELAAEAMPEVEAVAPRGEARGNGHTRRNFIRGVASAGASTIAATTLDAVGIVDLMEDSAVAAGRGGHAFSEFHAIAASGADAFEVPKGFRAEVLISWQDEFVNTDGTVHHYGFNNDFLAYFPLKGSKEGLVFVNHEYPAPFFQHGNTDPGTKTPEQIALEKYAVGNSVVHIRKDRHGRWRVVSPSPYSRRITGDSPLCEFTGPLKGQNSGGLEIGLTSNGSIANCSGGITPWGTALSCEENFQDYGPTTGSFVYGWGGEYVTTNFAKYGWVVETDPYDPSWTPRKHTALGRFRHENTAFRHVKGKRFVLYMGDDRANEGVYKFVSDLPYIPGRRSHNLKLLESGTLYVAKWLPEGRRRFTAAGETVPISATSGTGEWVAVNDDELADTATRLRTRLGATEFTNFYATNRPEDVEVDKDGSIYVSFTNNSSVNDSHGAIRKLREAGNNPEATTFTWADYAGGGPTGRSDPGERGFSSCDNLVIDKAHNLWVVTDISSSALQGSTTPNPVYAYHLNNAVFMVPRKGPNKGIAFRFANMPAEAEGTGPYFTPDGNTLFINVQHPGEETPARPGASPSDPSTFTSWWPDGNKTANTGIPGTPRPSTVVITRDRKRRRHRRHHH